MTKEIHLLEDLEMPAAQWLKAGKLHCLYENGSLRYIGFSNYELVRNIYGAVRMDDWTTLPRQISNEKIAIKEDSFSISYTAVYSLGVDLYQADYTIEGHPSNTISFSMKGVAVHEFKKNRIGLCLLHPLKECRGRNVVVTRPDTSRYESAFPVLVTPSLPFIDMAELEWLTEDGTTVHLTFEGDIFETEDQRNWSDASFKTYSTRSSLPKPVTVQTGDTIEQVITLAVTGLKASHVQPVADTIEVKVPFPQIGYSKSDDQVLNQDLLQLLKIIPFDHYRLTINLKRPNWTERLLEAFNEASQINTRLELVVFLSDAYHFEMQQLVDAIQEKQLLVRSILLLPAEGNVTPAYLLAELYELLKQQLPAVKIGYGTDGIFVNINDAPLREAPCDFISFGIQPQAHLFDSRSILENLQSHQDIMQTAAAMAKGLPVCISPVTINERHSGADSRQFTALAALYTLVSLQNFSEAYSITFHELFGDAGILQVNQDKQGGIKRSAVYETFTAIFQFQPTWVVKRFVDGELQMDGLLLENEEGERLFFKAPLSYQTAVGIR